MKKYKVMLNGQNFIIDLGEGEAKHGFYTTRYTHANTKADAESNIIDSINKTNATELTIKNDKIDPPLMYAEEIEEVASIDNNNQEHDLSWFKEEF